MFNQFDRIELCAFAGSAVSTNVSIWNRLGGFILLEFRQV